jgi:hypothetical protein
MFVQFNSGILNFVICKLISVGDLISYNQKIINIAVELNNNNNSIKFFIINVLHQQPEGQLQMQHEGIQNNKYNKITI